MTSTDFRTLEQRRARFAWECVEKVKKENFAQDYGQLAKSAPADILTNGLGQTLAFLRAKGYERGKKKNGNNEHAYLLENLTYWVKSQIHWRSDKELLQWIVEDASTEDYRRATTEALAFLQWLKRFAEAELCGEE